MNITAQVGGFALAVEVYARAIFLRVGPWELLAQREATPAPIALHRPGPGEVVLDLPGLSVMLMNHARL